VVVTHSEWSGNNPTRQGYRGGVFSVDNIVVDDNGIQFDFVGTYAQKAP
jgi:hypothetical protein